MDKLLKEYGHWAQIITTIAVMGIAWGSMTAELKAQAKIIDRFITDNDCDHVLIRGQIDLILQNIMKAK